MVRHNEFEGKMYIMMRNSPFPDILRYYSSHGPQYSGNPLKHLIMGIT